MFIIKRWTLTSLITESRQSRPIRNHLAKDNSYCLKCKHFIVLQEDMFEAVRPVVDHVANVPGAKGLIFT